MFVYHCFVVVSASEVKAMEGCVHLDLYWVCDIIMVQSYIHSDQLFDVMKSSITGLIPCEFNILAKKFSKASSILLHVGYEGR